MKRILYPAGDDLSAMMADGFAIQLDQHMAAFVDSQAPVGRHLGRTERTPLVGDDTPTRGVRLTPVVSQPHKLPPLGQDITDEASRLIDEYIYDPEKDKLNKTQLEKFMRLALKHCLRLGISHVAGNEDLIRMVGSW